MHPHVRVVLLVAKNLSAGPQFDQIAVAARPQENPVQVAPMNHCIRVAKALPEWFVERHANNFLGCHGIHQPKIVDVDSYRSCGVADSELIKRVEGVRAQLNTGADLSEFRGSFKHDASNTFAGKAECGG